GRVAARVGAVVLRDVDAGGGTDPANEIGAGLPLGAVPVHLCGVVDHERALGHAGGVVGVDYCAGAAPGGAGNHVDEAIVGMIVRVAEAPVRLEPVGHHLDAALVCR